jgi:hypothetical protein
MANVGRVNTYRFLIGIWSGKKIEIFDYTYNKV